MQIQLKHLLKVKMSSYWIRVAPKSSNVVIRRLCDDRDTHRHTENKIEAENGVMYLQAKELKG